MTNTISTTGPQPTSWMNTLIDVEGFDIFKVAHLKDQPHIWTLEFDHGKANEMGSATLDELEILIQKLSSTEGPNALISFSRKTTSKGTPIFIAGAHVTERSAWSQSEVFAHVKRQRRLLQLLRQVPVFHLCIPHGMALGWGCEFLITADYKVATPQSKFALPETGLGIVPGAGGSSELAGLIGVAHTLRLGMTGERITAEEALRINLVQELASDLSTALERAYQLATLSQRVSPTANAVFKSVVLNAGGHSLATRTNNEADAYEHCVLSGQASIGRTSFDAIRQGKSVAWGPKQSLKK